MSEETALSLGSLSPEEIRTHIIVSEEYYTEFSNFVRVAASPTEIRLVFGEHYPTAANNIEILEKFNVVMNPIHAKALYGMLGDTLAKLEAALGPIPGLEDMQDQLARMRSVVTGQTPSS